MSLKRLAMLSAISSHKHQNNNNNNNNSNINTNYNNKEINYNKTPTTFATTTAPELTATKIESNKSTLIQLKQQQQKSQKLITPPTFIRNTTTITATTTTTSTFKSSSSTLVLAHHFYSDKASTITSMHTNHHDRDDTALDIIDDDDSNNYSSESSESLDINQKHLNTYTSTTYYGSGIGVFHQQNTRSNGAAAGAAGGGGIALITGSSTSNGLGGAGSYSNGINNNVNLLLGGAMLTLITTILCVVCYCCHRNIKKRTEAAYRQQRQWLENDPNMEIYSVEQCYETSGLFVGESMDGLATIAALHHEPPPSYDAVVAMQEHQQLLMQQHQQQLLIQQQLLQQQQQLSTNNSPPPGYRSSLDVSSILQQGSGGLGLRSALPTAGGSIISGMEINSLTSSIANVRTSTSASPINSLLNCNDVNGNVESPVTVSAGTTNNNPTAGCYLRNKQQQLQRNAPAANQMNQLNMQKVLQAQSCCSLQRAEVENMWNAAAAALAARSAHLGNDASTSSPTLVMTARKQSQGCKNLNNTNTPETFGSRYLKQNYYRRGCPLCGKFRYDNDSNLSTSMESNLDTFAGALTEETIIDANDHEENTTQKTTQNNLNNNENQTLKTLEENCLEGENYENVEANDDNDSEALDDDWKEVDNDKQIEQQCSCLNSKRKNEHKFRTQENLEQSGQQPQIKSNYSEVETAFTTHDNNANCSALVTERQSTSLAASNNNNDIVTNRTDSMNLPSTSAVTSTTIPRSPVSASVSTASTSSVAINLDCINENGIISLDMSKIIDKTGLPTYDAALKLESSGYV